jgi:hypothetical protein
MKRGRGRFAFAIGSVFAPQLAQAHLISTGLGPVYDGITHFALTPEDLLPVLALAALAGLRGNEHARRVIFVLPLAWLVAGMAGAASGVAVPDVLAWLPLLVLGGLVASDLSLSPTATTVIAGLTGAALGFANGGAMVHAGAGFRGIAGSAGAVFVAATLAAAGASAWHAGWLRIVWRVAGSWIAAGGLLLLGWSLR